MSARMLVCMSAMFLNGCALMINGRNETLKINTKPEGAMFTCKGKEYTTPAQVVIPRKDEFHDGDAVLTKDGYQPMPVRFDRKMSWWLGSDILALAGGGIIGGVIGFGVDFSSGAAYYHDPNPAFFVLNPASPSDGNAPSAPATQASPVDEPKRNHDTHSTDLDSGSNALPRAKTDAADHQTRTDAQ